MGRATGAGVRAPDRSRPDDKDGSAGHGAALTKTPWAHRSDRSLPARNRSSSGKSGSSRPGAGESRTDSRATPGAGPLSSRRFRGGWGQRVEQGARLRRDAIELGRRTRLPQPQDDVERIDRRPTSANGFAQHALEPIAIDGASEKLFADHVSDASGRARGRNGQNP